MVDNLTLEELEKLSGLPIRTIRYYIQEGLLWGPDTRGKFATYSPEHLQRLQLIDALTRRTHLPLKEIRTLLDQSDSEQVQQIQDILADSSGKVVIIDADQEAVKPGKAGKSALDYLNNIRWVEGGIKEAPARYTQDPVSKDINQSSLFSRENQSRFMAREENWQRIALDKGIELHIRTPRDRKSDTKIRELLEFARRLFRS